MRSPFALTPFLFLLFVFLAGGAGAEDSAIRPVEVTNYKGDVMEPFLSGDGKFLFFNDNTGGKADKDLFWAKRIDPYHFDFMGRLKGVNSNEVDGAPSMDSMHNFYFISPRQYARENLNTIYRGKFRGQKGEIADIKPVGVASAGFGWVQMDVEVSRDGATLYISEADFSKGDPPRSSHLIIARHGESGAFALDPKSPEIMAAINKDNLVYAAGISPDELTIYYTRLSGLDKKQPKTDIMQAARVSKTENFGNPQVIGAIKGFVEGPALSYDGRLLYFHMRPAGQQKHGLYALVIKSR